MAKSNPNKPQFTGAQLNYLNSVLSGAARELQENIKIAKKFTGHWWQYSEKGTPEGEEAFENLNYHRSALRDMKLQLERINKLIVTVKGQRRGTL